MRVSDRFSHQIKQKQALLIPRDHHSPLSLHHTITMQLSNVLLILTLCVVAISSSTAESTPPSVASEGGNSTMTMNATADAAADVADVSNATLMSVAKMMAANGTEVPEDVKRMAEDVSKDACVSFVYHLDMLAGENELVQELLQKLASESGNSTAEAGEKSEEDGRRRLQRLAPSRSWDNSFEGIAFNPSRFWMSTLSAWNLLLR